MSPITCPTKGWESSLSRLRPRIKRFSNSGWPRPARTASDMNSNCQHHEAIRRGIRSLLTRDSLGICGEAENGKQAFEKVRELKLDLVILNVSMPVMNGVEAARGNTSVRTSFEN